MSSTYAEFIRRTREIGLLDSIAGLLGWDQETYMPPEGVGMRAEQLAYLAETQHERLTDPRLGELLAGLRDFVGSPEQAANLREMRWRHDRAVRVPSELVGRIARVSTHAKEAWEQARETSRFDGFAPQLSELLSLKREVADRIGYVEEPYDALFEEFEPGMTTREVSRILTELRGPLSALARRLAAAPRQPDTSILRRRYPQEAQARFGRRLAEAIGFDFQRGRIDVSVHPFCSGTQADVRLTTRYDETWFSSAIFGVLHEAGHGLYEQGLPAEHVFTPMGQPVSLGVHESQSRLWENLVGRSAAFWEHFLPAARQEFPAALADVSLDALVGAVNAVRPSLIRVEADEVTYNLHIILRFELERDLVSGRLAVADLPERWDAQMAELVGVRPGSAAEGCLQDIHWSLGAIGYFPTYALGNLWAAQLFEAAGNALRDLPGAFRRGEFRPLLDWLRTHVHGRGLRWRSRELIERVTGRPPSAEPFMRYLEAKLPAIYGL